MWLSKLNFTRLTRYFFSVAFSSLLGKTFALIHCMICRPRVLKTIFNLNRNRNDVFITTQNSNKNGIEHMELNAVSCHTYESINKYSTCVSNGFSICYLFIQICFIYFKHKILLFQRWLFFTAALSFIHSIDGNVSGKYILILIVYLPFSLKTRGVIVEFAPRQTRLDKGFSLFSEFDLSSRIVSRAVAWIFHVYVHIPMDFLEWDSDWKLCPISFECMQLPLNDLYFLVIFLGIFRIQCALYIGYLLEK